MSIFFYVVFILLCLGTEHALSAEKFQDYDILVACPHLDREIKAHNKRYIKNQIPMYALPPRMYGPVDILELYQDIKDVLAMFEKNPSNPVQFPGEKMVLRVNRLKAYRTLHPEFSI